MAVGNEVTVKYCDKGDTEGDLEFVVPATAGVVESVDLTVIVWSEFVLGDLEFVVPIESVDLMACVGSFEKSVFISPKLSVSVTKTLNHLFKNSILYTLVRESCSCCSETKCSQFIEDWFSIVLHVLPQLLVDTGMESSTQNYK